MGINTTAQDTVQAAEDFVKEFKLTYPILLDETDEVSDAYGLRGLPTSVFINLDGTVQRLFIGLLTREQMSGFIQEILK